MTLKKAASQLGCHPETVKRYAKELGIDAVPYHGPYAGGRGGKMFDFTNADLERMIALRSRKKNNQREASAENMRRGRRYNPEAAERGRINGRRVVQHRMMERQDRDYYGCVLAFAYQPAAVEDSELSSRIPGGPIMTTIQLRPFYPILGEDMTVWRAKDNQSAVWNHESLDDKPWMFDRHALQVWYEHDRRA